MLDPSVYPKVLFGSARTGSGSDDYKRALTKYNQHWHDECSNGNFYQYDLYLGQGVQTLENDDRNLFVPSTTLVSYNSETLTLSTDAVRSSDKASLQIGTQVLRDLVVTQGSPYVTSNKRIGFLSPATSFNDSIKCLSGVVRSSIPSKHYIKLASPSKSVLYKFAYRIQSANATATLDIGDRIIHTLSLQSTGTRTTAFSVSASQNPVVEKEQDILITLTSVGAETVIYYTLYYVDIDG